MISEEDFDKLKPGDEIVFWADTDTYFPVKEDDYNKTEVYAQICWFSQTHHQYLIFFDFKKGGISLSSIGLNQFDDKTVKDFFDKKMLNPINYGFWWLKIENIKSAQIYPSPIKDFGMFCFDCKEYVMYVEPNCKNDQFMCWRCRTWNQWKFNEVKL